MIAKKISMRTVSKSSFARLVGYISDSQNKVHRVGNIRITNCISHDLDWAKLEIQATQNKNTRSESDKTYHLLLSFPSGETLSQNQLHEIEDRFCKALGYEDHQRISAIHSDTDNLHIHIAINKIHPKSFNSYEPFNDYKILSSICSVVERDYDLTKTNHRKSKYQSQNKAQDMERFSGLESMIGWVQRECLEDIQNANSWEELNKILKESNLYIRIKGNGFVIGDRDNNFEVKASSIDRNLSKPNLEKKFGEYIQSEMESFDKVRRKYEKRPVYKRIDTTELYTAYLKQRQDFANYRTNNFKALKIEHQKKILAAKKSAQVKRNLIKTFSRGMSKKLAYASVSYELKNKIKNINAQYKLDRERLYESTKPLIWNDWLRKEALNGNETAAEVMQQQNFRRDHTSIYGDGDIKNNVNMDIDSITRRGSYILKIPGIRDIGSKINITQKSSDESILQALKLAKNKYGNVLKIDGDDLFKQQIVRVAAKAKLDIRFNNSGMERHRQLLIKEQEEHEQQRNQSRDGHIRYSANTRRSAGTRDGSSIGSRTVTSGNTRTENRSVDIESLSRGIEQNERQLFAQSNISKFTERTPTSELHCMPRLSDSDVASLEQRNKVLLSINAYNHLDINSAKRNEGMRWAAYFNGLTPEKRDAILSYVSERNNKRNNLKQVFDISNHSVYNTDIRGDIKYAGLRKVNEQNLVLLQKEGDSTIYVKDISAKEISLLKGVKLQSSINIDLNGKISPEKRNKVIHKK